MIVKAASNAMIHGEKAASNDSYVMVRKQQVMIVPILGEKERIMIVMIKLAKRKARAHTRIELGEELC